MSQAKLRREYLVDGCPISTANKSRCKQANQRHRLTSCLSPNVSQLPLFRPRRDLTDRGSTRDRRSWDSLARNTKKGIARHIWIDSEIAGLYSISQRHVLSDSGLCTSIRMSPSSGFHKIFIISSLQTRWLHYSDDKSPTPSCV